MQSVQSKHSGNSCTTRCYYVLILCRSHRQNSMSSCRNHQSTCTNDGSLGICNAGCFDNNSVLLWPSWCRTTWTVYHCTCLLKSLSRRTWTHELDLCAGLPSRTTFHVLKKVKSNYFIVRPKVDQRTGLLSLPHLGNFRRTHTHHICLYFVSIHQRATTGAQRCAPLVRLLTTHLPTPEGWKAELA